MWCGCEELKKLVRILCSPQYMISWLPFKFLLHKQQHVEVASSRKERQAQEKLSRDTPQRPHINSCIVPMTE
jgi:hypothetical protein